MTPIQCKRFLLYPALVCLALFALLFAACVGSVSAECNGYTVKAGDSLFRIAINHGETLAQLLADNGLTARSIIHPGDCLALRGQSQLSPTQSAIPWHPSTYGVKDLKYENVQIDGQAFAIDRKYQWTDSYDTDEQFTWDHWTWKDNDPTVLLMAHQGLAGQYINNLQVGDIIILQLYDGSIERYKVVSRALNWNRYSVSLFDKPNRLIMRTCDPLHPDGSSGLDLDITAERVP